MQNSQQTENCNFRLPLKLSIITAALTFIFAVNQQYLFDWDACFRAFTGFAGRDLVTGLFTGSVRSHLDIVQVLTRYSDFFEARPGSVLHYPPGQTLVLGILGIFSTNQFFLSLFNVACFILLSLGVWRVTARLTDGCRQAQLTAWVLVCLHPTIIITIWSMRRGLFEAMTIAWIINWLLEFNRQPRLRELLLTCTAICAGFLYRETLVLALVPALIMILKNWRRIEFNWRAQRFWLYAVTAVSLAGAIGYSAAQFYMFFKGQPSLLTKSVRYMDAGLPGGPPRQFLTMHGYYHGQFPPEPWLGVPTDELHLKGAPEVHRLAQLRWSLPKTYKAMYIFSGLLSNPFILILTLTALFNFRKHPRAHGSDLVLLLSALAVYLALLLPLGGIPDYLTPIITVLGLLAATGLASLRTTPAKIRLLTWLTIITAVAGAIWFLGGFAGGLYEEYPPRYDYDRLAAELLKREPGEAFGVAVDLHLVKNLAYSKFKTDADNRLACYSIAGARLPSHYLFAKDDYERYSPLLEYKRRVPGIRYLIFRSHVEQELWEKTMHELGFQPPFWDPARSFELPATRRRIAGNFRPLIIKYLSREVNKQVGGK